MFELLHSASIINRDRSVGDSPTLILCRCKGGRVAPLILCCSKGGRVALPPLATNRRSTKKYPREPRLAGVLKLMI